MLINPNSSETEAERRDVQAAAQAVGNQVSLDLFQCRILKFQYRVLLLDSDMLTRLAIGQIDQLPRGNSK
jgi:hypothetical protein